VFSPPGARPEGLTLGQPLGPESPSFAGLGASPAAPRPLAAYTAPGRGRLREACPVFKGWLYYLAVFRQLAAEPRSLCDWHF
jgi:hypothetical protein